jgi:hypothetical protein
MAKMTDRIADLERRMLFVEEQLGIEPTLDLPRIKKEKSPEPEQIINGYPKSQLLIMFAWARNLKLNQITKGDFEELKKWGVLRDFYPDAPENYGDIIL